MTKKSKLEMPNVDLVQVEESANKATVSNNETKREIYKTIPMPLTKKQYIALRRLANKEDRSMRYMVIKMADSLIEVISK